MYTGDLSFFTIPRPARSTLFPYTTLFRSDLHSAVQPPVNALGNHAITTGFFPLKSESLYVLPSLPLSSKSGAGSPTDRKSTRLNSSHGYISYAVFCLKKKKTRYGSIRRRA